MKRGAANMKHDIYLVGVGGQGILTIGEIIAEAALEKGIPANFYPTKGMAQRGGFVKAQLRLGQNPVGPNIAEKGADLVIAMELSESCKAVRYIKPEGNFILLGNVWKPTKVMLGKAAYPSPEEVGDQVKAVGGKLCFIDPASLPKFEGETVPENVFILGIVMSGTDLGKMIAAETVQKVIENRWKRGIERNLFAFQEGLKFLN